MSSGRHSHFCYNFDVCLFVCWHWHVNQQLFPTLHSGKYWTNYGKVAHVLYEFFQALFKFGNIFFKKCIFLSPGAPFLRKNPQIFFFGENSSKGCDTCVIWVFLSPFKIKAYFFLKNHFLALWDPFFKKSQNFGFFWKKYF